MKARLYPHENKDEFKITVQKDSQTAQFDIIRMLLSLAYMLSLIPACTDIKGVHLQSGPITQEIYIRPPREKCEKRKIFGTLKKLPYGITEAGKQRAKEIEGLMGQQDHLERIIEVSQLYIKRKSYEKLSLIIDKNY